MAANINTVSIKDAWGKLGRIVRQPHRQHRWSDVPDLCKGCGDWQVSGAEYEETNIDNVRPFWYDGPNMVSTSNT